MPDSWYQQFLTPPEVLEGALRVGLVPSEDHAQVLVELKDPISGVLIAQKSWPHVRIVDLPQAMVDACTSLLAMVDVEVEPF